MMQAWSSVDPLFLSRLFCIQSRLSLQQQQHSIYKKLSNFSVWTTFSFLSNLRSYHPTLSTRQGLVVELQKTTFYQRATSLLTCHGRVYEWFVLKKSPTRRSKNEEKTKSKYRCRAEVFWSYCSRGVPRGTSTLTIIACTFIFDFFVVCCSSNQDTKSVQWFEEKIVNC